MSEPTFQE